MEIFHRPQRLFFQAASKLPCPWRIGLRENDDDVICQRKDGEIGGQMKGLLLTYETYWHTDNQLIYREYPMIYRVLTRSLLLMATRNPAVAPAELGSLSNYVHVFFTSSVGCLGFFPWNIGAFSRLMSVSMRTGILSHASQKMANFGNFPCERYLSEGVCTVN